MNGIKSGLSNSGRGSRLGAPDSADSTDSGYDDYADEEYSNIITESSAPEKVIKNGVIM